MDKKSVVLIDMDMGMRNLDLYMGLQDKAVYNVSDALNGLCRIKQALIKDRRFEKLYLMAAPPVRSNGEITPLHVSVLCEKLKERFDYVIIDGPAGIDDGLVIAAAGADEAIIVTVPEFAAVRDAQTLSSVLENLGIKDRMYVLNSVKADLLGIGGFPSVSEIDDILRVPMAGIIQYDENIRIATSNGIPIVFKKDTYIYKNFKKILKRIVSQEEIK